MTDAPRLAPAGSDQVSLERWTVTSGSNASSRAAVVLRAGSHDWQASAEGTGAVDALFKAIDQALAPILDGHPRLVAYDVHALDEGPAAEGRVIVQIAPPPSAAGDRADGRFTGEVASTNTIAASVEAYVDALNAMLGEQSWAGAADEAGSRRSGGPRHGLARPDDRVRHRRRPHRHDGVVQPLGGDGSATAASAAIDPEAFNRFEAEGWEARADSYGFLAPITGRVIGALLAAVQAGTGRAAAGRRVRAGRPRGGGRPPGRGRGGDRRRAVDGPAGRARPPDDPVPGRLVRGAARWRGGVRRRRRQLRVQPRRPAGARPPRGAARAAARAAGSRSRPGMRRAAIACSGLMLDAVVAADAPPPPGLPAGPTNFRDDDELRALFEAAGFVEVGVSHLHFETAVADAETLWRGVLDSAVRIPPLVTEQPADVQVRIRAAFDELVAVHRREGGTLAIPVAVQVTQGMRP